MPMPNNNAWEQYLSNLEDSFSVNQIFLSELQKRAQENVESSLIEEEGELVIDIYKEPEKIIVVALITGVAAKDLFVNFNNGVLTIRGERKQPPLSSAADAVHRECFWGKFSRSIVLPETISADKIEAILKNGMLIVILPTLATDKHKINILEVE
ncbi:Hsp20/alpha crystallin family protein [Candidatus Falkowbacteria bacterium]|nr:Hsp20/alpha crystallin family protein [Candidatus Falkowbacteria bacterium]